MSVEDSGKAGTPSVSDMSRKYIQEHEEYMKRGGAAEARFIYAHKASKANTSGDVKAYVAFAFAFFGMGLIGLFVALRAKSAADQGMTSSQAGKLATAAVWINAASILIYTGVILPLIFMN